MGLSKRLTLIIAMLIGSGALAHWYASALESGPRFGTNLKSHLAHIPEWRQKAPFRLPSEIADELQLDDYVNSEYENDKGAVSVYIGQYHSISKVGAAHDPMVCFPGQGWEVSERSRGEVHVPGEEYDYSVPYAAMVAESRGQKIYVVYWFQSEDSAYSNTLFQKMSAFWNKLKGAGQSNAFVRITASLKDGSIPEARQQCFDFIRRFYPLYQSYIHQHVEQDT